MPCVSICLNFFFTQNSSSLELELLQCKTNVTEDAECWILQNSWGPSSGTEGFYFIHTDLDCDTGIISGGFALSPLIDVVKEKDTEDTSGAAHLTYLFLAVTIPYLLVLTLV